MVSSVHVVEEEEVAKEKEVGYPLVLLVYYRKASIYSSIKAETKSSEKRYNFVLYIPSPALPG